MHFTQREQAALREAGLSAEAISEVSEAVVATTEADAERVASFFESRDVLYSDMDLAHSTETFPEHAVDHIDLFTHADDIRGYLRFDSWGVPVEGARALSEDVVELSLGPTVDGRVRFAADRDVL